MSARKRKPSRQKEWQERMRGKGLCTICGKEELAEGSVALGERCLLKRREKERMRGGSRPWRKGGPGRPVCGTRVR